MTKPLPLFLWQVQAEHHRVSEKRGQLLRRIAALKPHAHKRLALEERVRQVTLRQIELENVISNREGRLR